MGEEDGGPQEARGERGQGSPGAGEEGQGTGKQGPSSWAKAGVGPPLKGLMIVRSAMMQVIAAVIRSRVALSTEGEEKLAQVMEEIWPDHAIAALLKTAGWRKGETDG